MATFRFWKVREHLSRFAGLFFKNRRDTELDEEFQSHLDRLVEENRRKGMSATEAAREASRSFGSADLARELYRDQRSLPLLETLIQDLRYAVRMLIGNPGFAVVAIIALALGIGANTAIFSVVNALLLKPLPYPDADRIVDVWHTPPAESFPGIKKFAVSPGNFLDWQKENHVFQQISVYSFARHNLGAAGSPISIMSGVVSADFFNVLRISPRVGRGFTAEDCKPGAAKVVILSDNIWKSQFGSNPGMVGQIIRLDGESYTVVGIMSAGFHYPQIDQFSSEIWTPVVWTEEDRQVRANHNYLSIARLNDGVTLAKAQSEMNTISDRLAQDHPEEDKGWGAVVIPMRDDLVGDIRPALLILLGAVAFVLLIACANVANLLLARAAGRSREIAVRTALGASRSRIIRQLLSESMLLGVIGGAVAVGLAKLGVGALVRLAGSSLPEADSIGIDAGVLGFTLAASLIAGLAAGLAPAWQLASGDINSSLKEGSGRTAGDRKKQRTRTVLVTLEMALSLVLLIGAGLLIRSFWDLQHVNPGFETGNILTMSMWLPKTKYSEPLKQSAFFESVLRDCRGLAGVVAAGATDNIPLGGGGSVQPFTIEGRPAPPISLQPTANARVITPDYFRVMGIPLQQGRVFTDLDGPENAQTVIISQSMAQRFWPGENPIGKRLIPSFYTKEGPREIVGVVGDVRADALSTDGAATMYYPFRQTPTPLMTLVVKTASDPAAATSAVLSVIHSIDDEQAVQDVATMEQVTASSLSQQRFNMILLGIFAGLALVLASVGIYGVISYSVSQRAREIGVRLALGASGGEIMKMVLGQGMAMAGAGIGVGLAAGFGLTRLISGLLYGVGATDVATFAGVSLTLAIIALLACYIPARRAVKVEPMIALRYE